MLRIALVGAGGYTGSELAELILGHPELELAGLFASERRAGSEESFADLFPRFRGRVALPLSPTDPEAVAASGARVAFLATPHEASLSLAPALIAKGIAVYDLSGAFRLGDPALYPRHYGFEHDRPDLLEDAVYGLPELHREELRRAPALVSLPGCYPTSAILPLRPLVDAGALRAGTRPIVDSISGVSGAGRGASQKVHFCEVSVQAYGVLRHRHQPEIDRWAGAATLFTPHLGAFDRGIHSTLHVELASGWNEARVREVLAERYEGAPFVQVLPPGHWPAIGNVRHTNLCHIGLAVDAEHGHLVLASAIDNLLKGASGQAIQALNVAQGFAETTGLPGGPR